MADLSSAAAPVRGGIGLDLQTGQLEVEIAPGLDVPLGDPFGW